MSQAQAMNVKRRQKIDVSQEQIVLGVTAVLFAFFAIRLPGFASYGNIITLLNSVAQLGILALGAAIVVIARGIDLSQIASMAAGAVVTTVAIQSGHGIAAAMALGLMASLAVGVVNGLIIAFIEIPALFATLATNILFYGLLRGYVQKGQSIAYLPKDATSIIDLGRLRVFDIPISVLIFTVMAVLVHLLLTRTVLGRFIYAHGDNPEAARLSGVPVRPLTILEYALSAVVAYVAGILLLSTTLSVDSDIINSTMIFNVILIVVLGGVSLVGGRGGVFSVVAGTLLIGTMLNGLTIMNVNNLVADMARGAVLMAAILLDNRLHPRNEETARQGE
ncbi:MULTISPECIES: ABC transporter permease [unclassified Mesorhizobium]|uniref:ABC transporter permease n=1 Tax=unclassified Mesorhizobium TaxID=325217 RepID=UPI000B06EF9F|nr:MULTISPECIES: ABC transporter permease [unclassified Mesorhizobium]